jgi:hypothetical protein
MEPILEIGTNDPPSFIDFFVPLARNLEGSGGAVYHPVPVVDPRAHEAVPPADHVLVSLSSPDDFPLVHSTMRDYIAGDPIRELTLENRTEDRTIVTKVAVREGDFPDEEVLRSRLFP